MIRGTLESASRCTPRFGKARGANPAQVLGLRFERQVAKALKQTAKCPVEYNPWFSFTDRRGLNFCSPDFVLPLDDAVVVIEVKYTFTPTAPDKLRDLYLPIVKKIYNREAFGLVLCKNLTPEVLRTVEYLSDVLHMRGAIPTLQWLGTGRIPW